MIRLFQGEISLNTITDLGVKLCKFALNGGVLAAGVKHQNKAVLKSGYWKALIFQQPSSGKTLKCSGNIFVWKKPLSTTEIIRN